MKQQGHIFKVTFMITGFALVATADITVNRIALDYTLWLEVALQCPRSHLKSAFLRLVSPDEAAGVDKNAAIDAADL